MEANRDNVLSLWCDVLCSKLCSDNCCFTSTTVCLIKPCGPDTYAHDTIMNYFRRGCGTILERMRSSSSAGVITAEEVLIWFTKERRECGVLMRGCKMSVMVVNMERRICFSWTKRYLTCSYRRFTLSCKTKGLIMFGTNLTKKNLTKSLLSYIQLHHTHL